MAKTDGIDQLGVIQMYYPSIRIGKKILSPFRDEKNPSCVLYNHNGHLIFRDYGGDGKYYDCIDLVMFKERCNFKTAMEIIKNGGYGQLAEEREYVVEKPEKVTRLEYDFEVCQPTEEHEEWRKKFHILDSVMDINKVLPVSKYTIYFESGSVTIFDHTENKPSHGLIWGIKSRSGMKFYQPASATHKWKSLNVEEDFLFGRLFIQIAADLTGQSLILCAGNKDTLILQSLGYYAITLNSEVRIPSEETMVGIEQLMLRIPGKLRILYDWDDTGIYWGKKMSEIMTERFGKDRVCLINMKNVLLPEYSESTKDIGDLAVMNYKYLCEVLKFVLS
jgi:hypothetical protein